MRYRGLLITVDQRSNPSKKEIFADYRDKRRSGTNLCALRCFRYPTFDVVLVT